MLGCTLKEYIIRFDNDLKIHLESYEDNNLHSFLKDQLKQFNLFKFELLKISEEIGMFDNKNASDIFIKSSTCSGLKKVDIDTYNYLVIEEKPTESTDNFSVSYEIYRNYSRNKVRLDHKRLKNIITSVENILEFLGNQSEILEDETKLPIIDSQPQESEIENPIDPILQKIEKYLNPYSNLLLEDDYKLLTNSLFQYFNEGNFPKLDRKIIIKKVSKKEFGWALNEIYTFCKCDELSYEYLLFAHENINLYEKNIMTKKKLSDNTLYKYFKSNPNPYKH